MKAKNQTANQILDFLREAEHQYPDWYQEATIVITDRGGEDPAAAFGFFKAEAEKEQDRKNNGPWAYSDEIEDHQIHIWRTDDDPYTRKENAAAEEIETLKKALKMANAERDRAEERLQAALRDLNTTDDPANETNN